MQSARSIVIGLVLHEIRQPTNIAPLRSRSIAECLVLGSVGAGRRVGGEARADGNAFVSRNSG